MGKVMYCEKCGRIGPVSFRKKCKSCGVILKIFPEEMKEKYDIYNDYWLKIVSLGIKFSRLALIGTIDEELAVGEELILRKNNFVMNELADNPLFSLEAYNAQVEEERASNKRRAYFHHEQSCEQMDKNLAAMQKEKDRQDWIPECPICGSSNIQKITLGTRAVKTAAFGVVGAVDDAGKTYKCSNCGSKF